MATSYKDLQDRVLDIISKSDATTRNRVKNWINLGQSDFVLREVWPFREASGDITLVQGTQEYTLSSEFSDIDEQNIISVAIQGSNQEKLSYWPYNQLRANAPDFDQDAQATPRRYYLKGGKIGFWPVPNAALTVTVDYYKLPTEMSADSDTSIIPVNYREALIHYALALEHDFNTDPDLAQKSQNRYEQILILARQNLLSQPLDTGNFKILGPHDYKDHLGLYGEVV